MAALQCDICGGRLIGKPGGIFECDSCGMEYSTEWAKAKIQEIKGTVKVEGTVQVTGTVQVDNNSTLQSLLKHGFLELEDGNRKKAEEIFQRAKDINAGYGDVYVGLLMATPYRGHMPTSRATIGCKTRSEFRRKMLEHTYDYERDFQKVLTYPGSDTLMEEVAAYQQMLRDEKENRKILTQSGKKNISKYRELRGQYRPLRLRVTPLYVLDQNGIPVSIYGNTEQGQNWRRPWKNMFAIGQENSGILPAIYNDGTVIAEVRDFGREKKPTLHIKVFEPSDEIIQVAVIGDYKTAHFYGLRKDGQVMRKWYYHLGDEEYCVEDCLWENPTDWTDVIDLCEKGAIRSDGTYLPYNGYDTVPFDNVAWVCGRRVLLTDGTVYTQSLVNEWIMLPWSDIIQITRSYGLKTDGTVLHTVDGNPSKYEICPWGGNAIFLQPEGYFSEDESNMMWINHDGVINSTNYKNTTINMSIWENIETMETDLNCLRENAYYIWKDTRKEQNEDCLQQLLELRKEKEALLEEHVSLNGVLHIFRRKELERKLVQVEMQIERLEEESAL